MMVVSILVHTNSSIVCVDSMKKIDTNPDRIRFKFAPFATQESWDLLRAERSGAHGARQRFQRSVSGLSGP